MSESQSGAGKTERNFGRSDSLPADSLTIAEEKILGDLAVGLDAVLGKRRQWICQCAATMGDYGFQCSFCTGLCDREWGV